MKWFPGPIQDAITTAKNEQKIFLVFVEGEDETSKKMMTTILQSEISKPIDDNCVAIKLVTDSEPFRQFSQIYPVIVVPSMFFIGNNGIPLEVIAGSENATDLSAKIQKAVKLHRSKLAEQTSSNAAVPSSSASTSSVPAAVAASNQEESHQATASSTIMEEDPETVPSAALEGDETEEQEAMRLLKVKMERAEKLMTERRILKEKERQEEEKRKELEHRRVSRELQKAREQMKDKEMAEWAKQKKKEKEEEKAARERILQQIAQDKADRAAKFQYSTGSPPSAASASQQPEENSEVRQRSPAEVSTSSSPVTTNVARIQLRFSNNTRVTHEFPSNATLSDVIKHIETTYSHFFAGFSGFSLATTFPRRHFAKCDHPRTLRDLELTPSAVLLVLPVSGKYTINREQTSSFWSIVWTILTPLTFIWGFISSLVFSTNRHPPVTDSSTASASTSQDSPPTSSKPSGSANASTTRYRRDGNIHRLSNESSNDDEDGTWNGNSTQQM